jgi:hypothetical protein
MIVSVDVLNVMLSLGLTAHIKITNDDNNHWYKCQTDHEFLCKNCYDKFKKHSVASNKKRRRA